MWFWPLYLHIALKLEVGLWRQGVVVVVSVNGMMGWHHFSFPQIRAYTGIDNTRPFRTLARERDGTGGGRKWAGVGEERGGKRGEGRREAH